MGHPIKVLLAEDAAIDAELEVRELERAGLSVEVRIVETEREFRQALAEFKPDVILSDFTMPAFDGMSALGIARKECPDVPFIFVSGTLGEEHAIRALKSGAVDYVLKHNLLRLPSSVERAVQEARSRRERRHAELELDATRERLASIFTTLRDILWSVDGETGELLYVSPAIEAIYGHPPEAYIQDKALWQGLVHPDDLARVQSDWRALQEGREFDSEYRIVRPDGGVRWMHDRGRRVQAGAGWRIDGVSRDVTEQAEQRLRIARLSSIRDVLSAVNNAIVRIRDRDELLDEACRIAVEEGGLRLARIAIRNAEDGEMHVVAARGEGREIFLDAGLAARHGIQPAGGLVAEAMAQGGVVIHNDLEARASAPMRKLMRDHGVRSSAAFPIVVDGVAVGAFVLQAREPDYFDHEEVRLLKEVSGNIAFALSLLRKQEELNYLAFYDPLTGLANRAFFHSSLAEAVDNARRHRHLAAVAAINIARFRAVNDALGQQAGDRLLQQVAERLRQAAGEDARVCRLNADLFCLVVRPLRDVSFIPRVLLERVAMVLDRPFEIDRRELRIAIRGGIAVFPYDASDAETLFRNAEAALARARASGERFTFYAPEMNLRFAERLETEGRLRRALERNELALYYQPKVEAGSRHVAGLEALMRWHDPEDGLVSPGKFIPILEDTGLIVEAGRWAMRQAVADQAAWRARGLRVPRVAVNVSALQLRQSRFVDDVRDVLEPLREDERALDLEITESVLMENMSDAVEKLKAARDLGAQIAIDDFGTGYSSLAYINSLPIHQLKIDRSFVSAMSNGGEGTGIVSTIIGLARGLGLETVAEGVETEAEARQLESLECDLLQGYLVGRPMPGRDVEMLLRA
jgi:diguanylate cyclase (GGDEF)-like protein/PAS domain S-box-containing protein